VVWIPDLNQHKILRAFALIFSKNYDGLRSHINSKECFIRYPNTSKPKHSISRLIYYLTGRTLLVWMLFYKSRGKGGSMPVFQLDSTWVRFTDNWHFPTPLKLWRHSSTHNVNPTLIIHVTCRPTWVKNTSSNGLWYPARLQYQQNIQ